MLCIYKNLLTDSITHFTLQNMFYFMAKCCQIDHIREEVTVT